MLTFKFVLFLVLAAIFAVIAYFEFRGKKIEEGLLSSGLAVISLAAVVLVPQ